MQPKRRWQLLIALVLLSLLINFWLGLHNVQLVPINHFWVLLLTMCLTPFLLWRASRLLAFLFTLLVLFGGVKVWLYGSYLHGVALYDCIERCAHLQSVLETYRRSHGVYPVSLDELDQPLPARVILPPQILMYRRTEKGYSI